MDRRAKLRDALYEKPCYIMDVLPKQVPKDSTGQFFDVEYYLLNSTRRQGHQDKMVGVILKLMCYYETSILWDGWHDRPAPELVEQAVHTIMENHSGTLEVLFPAQEVLLVFDWDCLNLSVYNPDLEMQEMMSRIAMSEGLFWWKSPSSPL